MGDPTLDFLTSKLHERLVQISLKYNIDNVGLSTSICDDVLDGSAITSKMTKKIDENCQVCPCRSVEEETRRRRRVNGTNGNLFPGLCLNSSLFKSNTLMKMSIIGNDLHNIASVQCRRSVIEIEALEKRIEVVQLKLNQSNEQFVTCRKAVSELHELCAGLPDDKTDEGGNDIFDDNINKLKTDIQIAKFIAAQADYEMKIATDNIQAVLVQGCESGQ